MISSSNPSFLRFSNCRRYSTKKPGDKEVYELKIGEIKGKSQSSTRWLRRKANDRFTKMAKKEGLVARSAYKVEEMIQKLPNRKSIKCVVELGAAPGGWTQIVAFMFPRAKIIALDQHKMNPIPNTVQLQMDFMKPESRDIIVENLKGDGIDLLLSDMAPAFCGVSSIDHMRMMVLAETAFKFGKDYLSPGASAIIKVNRGGTENDFKKVLEKHFEKVHYAKPSASFKSSSEIYLIANNFLKESEDELKGGETTKSEE